MNGLTFTLYVSGGTNGDLWEDWVSDRVQHTHCSWKATELKQLAAVALTVEECRRRGITMDVRRLSPRQSVTYLERLPNVVPFSRIGNVLPSREEEIDSFMEQHKGDYLTVAAWGDWHKSVPKGMVGVLAVRGGRTRTGQYASSDQRYFLVAGDEYDKRHENEAGCMVVDPARHPEVSAFN